MAKQDSSGVVGFGLSIAKKVAINFYQLGLEIVLTPDASSQASLPGTLAFPTLLLDEAPHSGFLSRAVDHRQMQSSRCLRMRTCYPKQWG